MLANIKKILDFSKFPITALSGLFLVYTLPLLISFNSKTSFVYTSASSDRFDLHGGGFSYFFQQFGFLSIFRFELIQSIFSAIFGSLLGNNILWFFCFAFFVFGLFSFFSLFFSKKWALFGAILGMVFPPFLIYVLSYETFFVVSLFPFFLFFLQHFFNSKKTYGKSLFWIFFLLLFSQNLLISLLFLVVGVFLFAKLKIVDIKAFDYKNRVFIFSLLLFSLIVVLSWIITGGSFSRIVVDSYVVQNYFSIFSPSSLLYSYLPVNFLKFLPFFGVFFTLVLVFGLFLSKRALNLFHIAVFIGLFSLSGVNFFGLFGINEIPLPGVFLVELQLDFLQIFLSYLFVFVIFVVFLMALQKIVDRFPFVIRVLVLFVLLAEAFTFLSPRALSMPLLSLPDADVVYYPTTSFDSRVLFSDKSKQIRYNLFEEIDFDDENPFADFTKRNYINKLHQQGVSFFVIDDPLLISEFDFLTFSKSGNYFVAGLDDAISGYYELELDEYQKRNGSYNEIGIEYIGEGSESLAFVLSSEIGPIKVELLNDDKVVREFTLTKNPHEYYIPVTAEQASYRLRVSRDSLLPYFNVDSAYKSADVSFDQVDGIVNLSGYDYVDIGAEYSTKLSEVAYSSFLSSFFGLSEIDSRLLQLDPLYLSFLVSEEFNTKNIEKKIVLPNKLLHPLAWNQYERIFSLFGATYSLIENKGVYDVYEISFIDLGREYISDVSFSENGFSFADDLGDVYAHYAYCNAVGEGFGVRAGEDFYSLDQGCSQDVKGFSSSADVDFVTVISSDEEDLGYSTFENISFSSLQTYEPKLFVSEDVRFDQFFDERTDLLLDHISLQVPSPSVNVAHFPLSRKAFISFDISTDNFYEGSSDVAFGFSYKNNLTVFNDYFPEMEFKTNNAQNLRFETDEIKEFETVLLSNTSKRVTFGYDEGVAILIVDGVLVAQGPSTDSFVNSFAIIIQGCCDVSEIDIKIENISYEIEA